MLTCRRRKQSTLSKGSVKTQSLFKKCTAHMEVGDGLRYSIFFDTVELLEATDRTDKSQQLSVPPLAISHSIQTGPPPPSSREVI